MWQRKTKVLEHPRDVEDQGKSNLGLWLIGPMVLTEKDNTNKGGCLVILILRLPGNQLVNWSET